MVPKTRDWVSNNVIDGTVTDGEFIVNIPVDALAIAKREKRLPPNSIDLHFRMADVSTRYFKELPPLIKASGEAWLKDDDFRLEMTSGEIVLPSGKLGSSTRAPWRPRTSWFPKRSRSTPSRHGADPGHSRVRRPSISQLIKKSGF